MKKLIVVWLVVLSISMSPLGIVVRTETLSALAKIEHKTSHYGSARSTVTGAGFEIIYDDVVYESTWPIERWIKRNVTVKSTSSENLSLDYDVVC
ncbi:MAG: hypothetical protein AB1485_01450, partial [Candidatus Thermoplasmatota archaeon]